MSSVIFMGLYFLIWVRKCQFHKLLDQIWQFQLQIAKWNLFKSNKKNAVHFMLKLWKEQWNVLSWKRDHLGVNFARKKWSYRRQMISANMRVSTWVLTNQWTRIFVWHITLNISTLNLFVKNHTKFDHFIYVLMNWFITSHPWTDQRKLHCGSTILFLTSIFISCGFNQND